MNFFGNKYLFRRKQYLIKRDFQFRYIGLIIGLTCIICIAFVLSTKYYINLNLNSLIESGMISSPVFAELLDIEKKFLNKNLLTIFLFLISVLAISGIFITHRIAGPIYALERRMKEISDKGFLDSKFQIRKGDEFQELIDVFNNMMNSLEKKYGNQKEMNTIEKNKAA